MIYIHALIHLLSGTLCSTTCEVILNYGLLTVELRLLMQGDFVCLSESGYSTKCTPYVKHLLVVYLLWNNWHDCQSTKKKKKSQRE